MDFNSLIPALDSDRIDRALAWYDTITEERLLEADFRSLLYGDSGHRRASCRMKPPKKWRIWLAKKVGVVTGYTGALTMKDATFDVTLEHYTKGVDGAKRRSSQWPHRRAGSLTSPWRRHFSATTTI
ncbi:MAG: hypothetical protein ACLR23_18280 [Clostridia bacterium]